MELYEVKSTEQNGTMITFTRMIRCLKNLISSREYLTTSVLNYCYQRWAGDEPQWQIGM